MRITNTSSDIHSAWAPSAILGTLKAKGSLSLYGANMNSSTKRWVCLYVLLCLHSRRRRDILYGDLIALVREMDL